MYSFESHQDNIHAAYLLLQFQDLMKKAWLFNKLYDEVTDVDQRYTYWLGTWQSRFQTLRYVRSSP